jgi:hypothetical protein
MAPMGIPPNLSANVVSEMVDVAVAVFCFYRVLPLGYLGHKAELGGKFTSMCVYIMY